MAKRQKKQQPTGMKASISRGRMLSGGQTWELNVYEPRVRGQRSDLKIKHLESPLEEANRQLAAEGFTVLWTETANGCYVGDVLA